MIQIINTGVANIRSLQAAFDRLEQPWNLTESADAIVDATHVVLPGVGAFAAAAESLDNLGIRSAITKRLQDPEKATLCICLGMQLLFERSEEASSAIGLGIIPGVIQRFPDTVQVPQLGWNRVEVTRRAGSLSQHDAFYEDGEAYFANSFRLTQPPPEDWGYAETDYGGTFVSSVWKGAILACQFHPELSGQWGRSVLENWTNKQGVTRC